MQVQYPVSNLITSETIKNKVISTWAIAPRKLCNDVEEFLRRTALTTVNTGLIFP